ncbi:MAG: hypothetical protein RLZZ298_2983 [Pseudomonadota bacterium]|jgi:hypothetical protein
MECATSAEIGSALVQTIDIGMYSGAAILALGFLMARLQWTISRFAAWLDSRNPENS